MGRVIGIDLGTTNSAVAIIEGGMPRILENAESERTTPSVVSFLTEEEFIVGSAARERASLFPLQTVSSIKRFIGTSFEERKHERDAVSYVTEHAADGGVCIKIKTHERSNDEIQQKVHELVAEKGARCGMNYLIDDIDGHEYSPVDISSFLLEKLKADAEQKLGGPVDAAVITVPAYFNDAQRQATRLAGKEAGLDVLRIISEPTAAALAYGAGSPELDETILVFDLGGGTFDVSLLSIEHGVFRVLATAGDNHLGGDDWDWRLANYAAEAFKKQYGVDLRDDTLALQSLREASAQAKIELSDKSEAVIAKRGIVEVDDCRIDLEIPITRERFEGMTEPLRRRIDVCMKEIMSAVEHNGIAIDKVVLVGGSTRMPAIRELVRRWTSLEPDISVNPDEAVALGAAVQAGMLTGDVQGVELFDVTPLSLGVETRGALVRVLIPRHTPVPVQTSRTFMTTEENQTAVQINIVQGERSIAADNKSLGMFRLEGIPPLPAGKAKIEVIFDIDVNNILSVVAREQVTGNEQQLFITGSHELDEAEVQRILADAAKNAEADAKREHQMTAEEEAESLVYWTRRALSTYASMLGFETSSKLRMKTNRIADAVADHAPEEKLRELCEDLRESRKPLEKLANDARRDQDGWTLNADAPKDVCEHWKQKQQSAEGVGFSGKLW